MPRYGTFGAEFFDVDKSRSIPWQRRPGATALLGELQNPTVRANVPDLRALRRPAVGVRGRRADRSEERGSRPGHVRVRRDEQGGAEPDQDPRQGRHERPGKGRGPVPRRPSTLRVLDRRRQPAPQPAKAADGKRLHKLDLDPEAAPVVRRIFAELTARHGLYAIAEGLTRDVIPSPSAHDPDRNQHRSGIARNKFAARSILINPRYTGHQCGTSSKDEVLIDVEDVALGHTTKLRWNETGKWLWSEKSGCVWCGLCSRRMQSHWVHGDPYCRRRFPAEYALANHVEHPLSVNVREDAVIGHVDRWLAREFAPHRLTETIRDLAAAQRAETTRADDHGETARKIADCDRKLVGAPVSSSGSCG